MVRYLKRLKSSKFVRVKAFPMYGGMGVSAPSLHRESTDSLIQTIAKLCLLFACMCVDKQQILFSFKSYHKLLFKEFTQMHNTSISGSQSININIYSFPSIVCLVS